jgi:hypothetical protein
MRNASERVGPNASLIVDKSLEFAGIVRTIIKRPYAKIQILFGTGFALLRIRLLNTAYATKISITLIKLG